MIAQTDLFETKPIEPQIGPIDYDPTIDSQSRQIDRVVAVLKRQGYITNYQATIHMYIWRLGSIIHKLRTLHDWKIRTATKKEGWDRQYAKYIVEKVGE